MVSEEEIEAFEKELNEVSEKYEVGPFIKEIDEEDGEITYIIPRNKLNRHISTIVLGNINKHIEKYSMDNNIVDYYKEVFIMIK